MFKKVYKVLGAGHGYDENGNPIVSLLATFDTLEEAQEYLATNEQLSIWKNGFITDAICMRTLS